MSGSFYSRDNKRNFIVAIALLIMFVSYTIAVCTFDVAPIGPMGSSVGFASLNGYIAQIIPFNRTLYNISEVAGYLGIATAGIFAMVGFCQLVKRKSFLKVDVNLYVLASLYGIALATYLLFDRLAINFRPVIIDEAEGLDPSYPSSHTLLSFTFLTGAIIQLPYYIKSERMKNLLTCACILFIAVVAGGRILSGAHWLTDIVGSIILGAAYTQLAIAFTRLFAPRN